MEQRVDDKKKTMDSPYLRRSERADLTEAEEKTVGAAAVGESEFAFWVRTWGAVVGKEMYAR